MKLEELRKLEAAASKGPWFNGAAVGRSGDVIAKRGEHGELIAEDVSRENIDFIAALRNAAPHLLAVVCAVKKIDECHCEETICTECRAQEKAVRTALAALDSDSAEGDA